ncbi:hypothetical protein ACIQOV_13190 [Kitasatospora sp. NPDC091257]|uniref:hypothetical protein n=1 Tax=Kitasatospora sp. NPDC091257 TaxID=3364084 RepID=UPI0037F83AAF
MPVAVLASVHDRLHAFAHRHLGTPENADKRRQAAWFVISFFAAGVGASAVYLGAVGLGIGPNTAVRIALAVWAPVLVGLAVWPLVEPGMFRMRWVVGVLASAILLGLALSALFV